MQLGEIMSRYTVKVQWQIEIASFGLQLSPGFTSTSPLRDTRRLKKRQLELIKWWRKKWCRKIKRKKGAACCFLMHYA